MFKTITRKCVCGRTIPPVFCLCKSCQVKYGMDRSKWEEWLTFMVADLDREFKQEVEIDDNEITTTDLGLDLRFERDDDDELD